MSDALVCDGLGKVYDVEAGTITALADLTFRLPEGQATAVVGRNGAGKSTLLKLIAGVTAPTSGQLVRPRRTSALIELGAWFQPELTGRENLHIGLALAGFGARARRVRAVAVEAFAGIDDALLSPVRQYSDGMRARLAVAIALHSDPELLLVDEVLAVGDGRFQRAALTRARELCVDGMGLLLVTHDPVLARTASDTVLWIDGGRQESHGSPDATVDAYLASVVGSPAYASTRHSRIEDVRVEPRTIGPGEAVEVAAVIRRDEGAPEIRFRIDLRPPATADATTWMRELSEPPELREWNVVAWTDLADLGPLGPGTHRIRARVPCVPVTPPGVEVLLTLIDASDGAIVDELGTEVVITGPASDRKLLLSVSCEIDAVPGGSSP